MPVVQFPDRLGRFLFRWRGPIGLAGFCIIFLLSRPAIGSCVVSVPVVLVGLGIRFWAMGYVGKEARGNRIGAERLVREGPYRLFRLSRGAKAGHPLYAGNLFLVVGTLIALRPPLVLGVAVTALFLVEYFLIARTEERHLAQKFAGVKDVRVDFSLQRALVEWRTMLAMVLVYGLAVAWLVLRP